MYQGRNLLLKVYYGGQYVTVGGVRSKSARLGLETIDITNSESWDYRQFKDGGYGTRTLSISIAGISNNSLSLFQIENATYTREIVTLKLLFPNDNAIDGTFRITNFSYTGSHSDIQSFSATIESAGIFIFSYSHCVPIDWTNIDPIYTRPFYGLGYDADHDVWISSSDNGYVYYSADDGLTWSEHYCGTNVQLADIAYGGGSYVAVGQAGYVMQTTDFFSTWIRRADLPNYISGIDYANGYFVITDVVGRIYRSADGTVWEFSDYEASGSGGHIRFDGVHWICAGYKSSPTQGFIQISNDIYAASFSTVLTGLTIATKQVGYSNETGEYLIGSTTPPYVLYKSSDLISWTLVGTLTGPILDIFYSRTNKCWCILGASNLLLTSTDLITFTQRIATSGGLQQLNKVQDQSSSFLAVGNRTSPPKYQVWRSVCTTGG